MQDTPYSTAPVKPAEAAGAWAIIVRSPAAAGRPPNLSHRAPGPAGLFTALLPVVPAALAKVAGPATASAQAAIVASAAARLVMHSSAGLAPAIVCTIWTRDPPIGWHNAINPAGAAGGCLVAAKLLASTIAGHRARQA